VRRKSYVCKLADLNDPWDNMAKYMAGMPVTATIRQVAERYLTCELEEGIEGFVPVGEVSWDSIEENLKAIKKYVVGNVVTAQITRIETARRVVLLSTKRIVKNPVQDYFELNKNTIIHVTVHAVSSFGAEVTINGTPYRGYVPVSEVLWGFCRNVGDYLKPGQTISAKPLRYNEYRNNIIVSPKRSTPNDFDTFRTSHQVGAVVKGRAYIIEDDKIGIRIEFDEGLLTEAYVHKSQLSSVLFIDEKLIHEILDIGKEYKFLVKRFDTKSKVVELSRKEFLRATIGELSYGTEYPAKIIKSRNGYIACGDNFEGVLIEKGRRGMAYPKSCMVIVAGIDRNKNRVELTVSSHT